MARALTGGSIRGRLFLAFTAVAIPPILLLAGLVLVLLTRSFERTAAARLESAADAVSGALARMESSARGKLAALAGEDLAAAGDARHAADAIARRADLAALEIVAADGTVLSSRHWPAGFGLRDQDRTFEGAARFRMEKVSEGYGAVDRLAVVAEAPALFGGRPAVVRGGAFVDAALLDEMSRLTGAAVAVRDDAAGWIVPAPSPLEGWSGPAGASSGRGRPRRRALPLVGGGPRARAHAGGGGATGGDRGGDGRDRARDGHRRAHRAGRRAGRGVAPVVPHRGPRRRASCRESRERVLQAERVAAWREMARRLAHELKNPIFPIQLSIETLRPHRRRRPAGGPAARRPVPRVQRHHPRRAARAAEDRRRVQRVRAHAAPRPRRGGRQRGGGAGPAPSTAPRAERRGRARGAGRRTSRRCRRTATCSRARSATWSATRSTPWAGAGASSCAPARPRTRCASTSRTPAPASTERAAHAAVHAVLHDQEGRHRPRPGHRAGHRLRPRRPRRGRERARRGHDVHPLPARRDNAGGHAVKPRILIVDDDHGHAGLALARLRARGLHRGHRVVGRARAGAAGRGAGGRHPLRRGDAGDGRARSSWPACASRRPTSPSS